MKNKSCMRSTERINLGGDIINNLSYPAVIQRANILPNFNHSVNDGNGLVFDNQFFAHCKNDNRRCSYCRDVQYFGNLDCGLIVSQKLLSSFFSKIKGSFFPLAEPVYGISVTINYMNPSFLNCSLYCDTSRLIIKQYLISYLLRNVYMRKQLLQQTKFIHLAQNNQRRSICYHYTPNILSSSSNSPSPYAANSILYSFAIFSISDMLTSKSSAAFPIEILCCANKSMTVFLFHSSIDFTSNLRIVSLLSVCHLFSIFSSSLSTGLSSRTDIVDACAICNQYIILYTEYINFSLQSSYIHGFLYRSCRALLTLQPISKASFSVSLLLATSDSNKTSFHAFSWIALRATSDQFISGNLSICFFNSSGTASVIFTMFCRLQSQPFDICASCVECVYKPYALLIHAHLPEAPYDRNNYKQMRKWIGYPGRSSSILSNSSVENTCTVCWFFNALSLDHRGYPSISAKAKYSISSSSGQNAAASFKYRPYEYSETSVIFDCRSNKINSNRSLFNFALFINRSLCASTSFRIILGAKRVKYGSSINARVIPSCNSAAKKIFASITKSIQYHSGCFFLRRSCIDFFTVLPSFIVSSSVSSEFSSILSSFFSKISLLTLSVNIPLNISDQFISGSSSISFFNSAGMAIVRFGIAIPPQFPVYTVYIVLVYKPYDSPIHSFSEKQARKQINHSDKSLKYSGCSFLRRSCIDLLILRPSSIASSSVNLDFAAISSNILSSLFKSPFSCPAKSILY